MCDSERSSWILCSVLTRHDQRATLSTGMVVSLSAAVRSPSSARLMLAEPVLDFAKTHLAPAPPELRFEMRFSRLASVEAKKNGTTRVLGVKSADAVAIHPRALTNLMRCSSSDSP